MCLSNGARNSSFDAKHSAIRLAVGFVLVSPGIKVLTLEWMGTGAEDGCDPDNLDQYKGRRTYLYVYRGSGEPNCRNYPNQVQHSAGPPSVMQETVRKIMGRRLHGYLLQFDIGPCTEGYILREPPYASGHQAF